MKHLSPASRRWLATTALARLEETTTTDAPAAAEAIRELLADTPAEADAQDLKSLTEKANSAARRVLSKLGQENPTFP